MSKLASANHHMRTNLESVMIWIHERKSLKLSFFGGEREMEEKLHVKKIQIKVLRSLLVYNSSLRGMNNTEEHIHTINHCVQMWLTQKELDAFQRRWTVQVPWTSEAGMTKPVAGSYRSTEEWLCHLFTYCLRPSALRTTGLGTSWAFSSHWWWEGSIIGPEFWWPAQLPSARLWTVGSGWGKFSNNMYINKKLHTFHTSQQITWVEGRKLANIIHNDHPQFLT